jgi:hypothetical protein
VYFVQFYVCLYRLYVEKEEKLKSGEILRKKNKHIFGIGKATREMLGGGRDLI